MKRSEVSKQLAEELASTESKKHDTATVGAYHINQWIMLQFGSEDNISGTNFYMLKAAAKMLPFLSDECIEAGILKLSLIYFKNEN